MRTRQPNINTPRSANERRPAQNIPSEADKIKSRLARIAALRESKANAARGQALARLHAVSGERPVRGGQVLKRGLNSDKEVG